MSRDRVSGTVSQSIQHPNKELIDTTKALIELYKSAFGDQWENVFGQTVKVAVSSS